MSRYEVGWSELWRKNCEVCIIYNLIGCWFWCQLSELCAEWRLYLHTNWRFSPLLSSCTVYSTICYTSSTAHTCNICCTPIPHFHMGPSPTKNNPYSVTVSPWGIYTKQDLLAPFLHRWSVHTYSNTKQVEVHSLSVSLGNDVVCTLYCTVCMY